MGVRYIERLQTCVENSETCAVQSDLDAVSEIVMFSLRRHVSVDGSANIVLEHTYRHVSSLNGRTRQGVGGAA